jgi:chromosome segregation ATPase
MFENLRRAWHQAVDNFWAELEEGEESQPARGEGVYRQVASARNQIRRLEQELADTRRAVEFERDQVEVCARRARLAREIGDDETERVALEFRARHGERAAVLGGKADALQAELDLWRRELVEMERALQASGFVGGGELEDLNQHPRESEFRTLEDAARERAAAARLEELKRRQGG